MGWVKRIFDDDPAARVARDRLIERILADPHFEHHRSQTKRGFPEPRLELPSVETADDALGERLGMALRLVVSEGVLDATGEVATDEMRVQLAANVLLAPIIVWPNEHVGALLSLPMLEFTVSHATLPMPQMWWTYQDSPTVSDPDGDITLDARFVQSEGESRLSWVDMGAQAERQFVRSASVSLPRTWRPDPLKKLVPDVIAALSYLGRSGITLEVEHPAIRPSEGGVHNIVRFVRSFANVGRA